jgi:hypothetical protein
MKQCITYDYFNFLLTGFKLTDLLKIGNQLINNTS